MPSPRVPERTGWLGFGAGFGTVAWVRAGARVVAVGAGVGVGVGVTV